jgi:transposase-like protein
LDGAIEADETHIGGKRKNMSNAKRKALKAAGAGRGAVGKEAVMGARERGGRTIAKHVQATDAATLMPFIEDNAEQGSTVCTDDAAAYGALPAIINQFSHDTVSHSASECVRGDVHTNGIGAAWAVLKRSITGTWRHVSPKHLGRCVNEAAFRLNEGNCENDTMDRMAFFAADLHGKRLRCVDLIADNGKSAQVVPA